MHRKRILKKILNLCLSLGCRLDHKLFFDHPVYIFICLPKQQLFLYLYIHLCIKYSYFLYLSISTLKYNYTHKHFYLSTYVVKNVLCMLKQKLCWNCQSPLPPSLLYIYITFLFSCHWNNAFSTQFVYKQGSTKSCPFS